MKRALTIRLGLSFSLATTVVMLAGCGSAGKLQTLVQSPTTTNNTVEKANTITAKADLSAVTDTAVSKTNTTTNGTVTVTADRTQLAFAKRVEGSYDQIFIAGTTGGKATQLTFTNGNKIPLRWAADGKSLYFLTEVEFAVWQVYSVPVTGGTPTRLTKDNKNYLSSAVSPDGSRLAVIFTDRNGNSELNFLSLPFGTPRKVTILGKDEEVTTSSFQIVGEPAPVWSPDGSEILYIGFDDNRNYELMAVPWCGGVPRQITQDNLTGMSKKGIAWSPDGKTIAYTSFNAKCLERIYTVPATGGKSKIVGNLNNEILLSPPTWSPDSKKIAYASFTGFHIIPANGGTMANLSFGDNIPTHPVWSGNL